MLTINRTAVVATGAAIGLAAGTIASHLSQPTGCADYLVAVDKVDEAKQLAAASSTELRQMLSRLPACFRSRHAQATSLLLAIKNDLANLDEVLAASSKKSRQVDSVRLEQLAQQLTERHTSIAELQQKVEAVLCDLPLALHQLHDDCVESIRTDLVPWINEHVNDPRPATVMDTLMRTYADRNDAQLALNCGLIEVASRHLDGLVDAVDVMYSASGVARTVATS